MTSWAPDLGDGRKPLYLSLADALADDVASGALAGGDRLPPPRERGGPLGVPAGPGPRGYAEAARRGLLSGGVGRGPFVRSDPAPRPADARDDGLVDMSVNYPPVTAVETSAFR